MPYFSHSCALFVLMCYGFATANGGHIPVDKLYFDVKVQETAIKRFYKECNGENWPKQFTNRWTADDLCAWDGNERAHQAPAGVRCVANRNNKLPPEGYGGVLFFDHPSGAAEGQVPEEFQALQTADFILLGGNKLHGPLWNTSYHTFLHRLDVSQNRMSGKLGKDFMQRNRHAEIINLGFNRFEGELPARINDLESLSSLSVNSNLFSGVIPDLSKCSQLRQLNFSDNQFTGNLPWVKELKNLAWLELDNNKFSGTLPELPMSISHFSAKGSGFSGTIPESYGKLGYLHVFDCRGCDIKCPTKDLLNHVYYSSHCKERPNPPGVV
eukprot:Tbor_TRINITY_DN5468_c0_g1::TRINITY_DN5468_c0_g1_i1::g.25194::m.25194